MAKIAAVQRIRPPRRKKIDKPFSHKSPQNVLENTGLSRSVSKPQTLRRKKRENALDLTRTLCVLANAAAAARKPPALRSEREQNWVAQALDLLKSAPALTDDPLTPETWGLGTLTISECSSLADVLTDITLRTPAGLQFSFQPGALLVTQERPGHYGIAGGYALGDNADLFSRVLEHRAIDLRRFARCANNKCQAFFYKPRLSSQACSRKCVDVLMAREHYHRVQTALQLKAQGKNLSEIAAHLRVKPNQVRRYLKQRR
jgi:hypothetical protein